MTLQSKSWWLHQHLCFSRFCHRTSSWWSCRSPHSCSFCSLPPQFVHVRLHVSGPRFQNPEGSDFRHCSFPLLFFMSLALQLSCVRTVCGFPIMLCSFTFPKNIWHKHPRSGPLQVSQTEACCIHQRAPHSQLQSLPILLPRPHWRWRLRSISARLFDMCSQLNNYSISQTSRCQHVPDRPQNARTQQEGFSHKGRLIFTSGLRSDQRNERRPQRHWTHLEKWRTQTHKHTQKQ